MPERTFVENCSPLARGFFSASSRKNSVSVRFFYRDEHPAGNFFTAPEKIILCSPIEIRGDFSLRTYLLVNERNALKFIKLLRLLRRVQRGRHPRSIFDGKPNLLTRKGSSESHSIPLWRSTLFAATSDIKSARPICRRNES